MTKTLLDLQQELAAAKEQVTILTKQVNDLHAQEKAEAVSWIKQQMKDHGMTIEDVRKGTNTRLRFAKLKKDSKSTDQLPLL